jgi:hypothetical protein
MFAILLKEQELSKLVVFQNSECTFCWKTKEVFVYQNNELTFDYQNNELTELYKISAKRYNSVKRQ